MKADRTALIVGAGIGGLAAGVALRRAGWDVRVYERARSARELGFGLLLAPNALAALRELGVASSLTGPAQQTGNVEVRCLDGRLIRRLHNPLGGRAVVALRKELHEALLTAVGEDSLRLSSEAASFSQASERVTLTLADGRQVAGAILVGADGMRSAIRRQLHPDELPPAPSGFSAIRGLAYDALPALGSLSGVAYLDDGIEAAAMRAGTDAIYWYVSLLSAEIAEPYARAFVTKLLPTFDRTFRAIVEATASEDMRFDELSMREPLDSWGMGRVTLLGDAAHPVLPHTGQGAAQALEDAVAIGLSLRGPGDPAVSLRRYEHVRARRTRSFVRLGPRIARATTTHNGAIRLARSIALRILPEFLLAKPMAALARDPHTRLRE